MSTLSELTVQILTSRMAKKELTLEEIQKEMIAISKMITGIENGTLEEPVAEVPVEEPKPEKINFKKIFKDKEVICLLCNRGFKTLKRHLATKHQITDKEYKLQFGIPAKQLLVAKSYSEERKQAAIDRGQGEILAKARAVMAAKRLSATSANAKGSVPVVKVKTTVPAKIEALAPAKAKAEVTAISKKKTPPKAKK